MLPPRRRTPAAVSVPAEEERARNWEERKQQSNWAQSHPRHGSETSPNRTHNNTQGNHEVRALQQPPNVVHAERAINKHPPSLYKVPAYSTRAGAAPRALGGARHGGGNRAVTSQPRTGQSTPYGDVKSLHRGAGRWERSGCAKGAPRSANRQGEEQHRHTERGSHTRRDKGEHSRQGGEAQQGRRGNQNSGNREPEWRGWESVRMGGSDNKGDGLASQPRRYRVPGQPLLNRHQVGQTSREGGKDIWWMAGTTRGGTGHLGLTHTETQRGTSWTACGQRCVDSKNSQTTPATNSTSSIRQLLGAADAQTAHHATFSTAPTHQRLGFANLEMAPARALAAAADRTQQPDATCGGKNKNG